MMANVYDIDHKELVALTVDELRAYGAAKWISGNNDWCEDDGTEDEVELRVVVRCRDCKRAHFQWHDYYDESPECFTPDPTDFAHEGRIHQPIVHDPIRTTTGGIN